MRLQELGDERVEVEENELVNANKSRNEVDHHDLDLEALGHRLESLEHLLGKTCSTRDACVA